MTRSTLLSGFVLVAAGLLVAGSPLREAQARHHRHRGDTPASNAGSGAATGFDYYLMALSWSPGFCATHPREAEQCGSKEYGFVLHGIWPQYERGYGPQHCAAENGPDAATVARMLPIMPSRHLIQHEWETHGSCSGLGASAYFDVAARAFTSVRIPAALQTPHSPPRLTAGQVLTGFAQANPGMPMNALSVHCSGNELAEVRVCLGPDLSPRRCGAKVDSNCPASVLRIPATR
ncbi:MAG: ribonuclease T2 [Tahibacter sp.]